MEGRGTDEERWGGIGEGRGEGRGGKEVLAPPLLPALAFFCDTKWNLTYGLGM